METKTEIQSENFIKRVNEAPQLMKNSEESINSMAE